MSWNPKYIISNKPLLTTREIRESIGEIKALRLTDTALAKSELLQKSVLSHNIVVITPSSQLLHGFHHNRAYF